MTEEVRKLIDELPVVAKSVINWKDAELVDKDDVIALLEKLTGENERIINIIRNYFHCNNNIDYQSFEQAYGELSYLLDVEYPNKNKIEVSDNDLPY